MYQPPGRRGVSERHGEIARDFRHLGSNEVGNDHIDIQAPFHPYLGLGGLGLVVQHELLVEALRVFDGPYELRVAALEGAHHH
jgi:hypothetical protein